jgi:hypothetical protein
MDHGRHTRKGARKDASSLWVLEATAVSLPTKVRLLMVQTFIYSAVMYGAEVWDTTKAVKDKMSAVVRKLSQHSSPASQTALLTFCTGTLGYFHPVYSLMLQTVLAAQI